MFQEMHSTKLAFHKLLSSEYLFVDYSTTFPPHKTEAYSTKHKLTLSRTPPQTHQLRDHTILPNKRGIQLCSAWGRKRRNL